jgi:hypothetical protein
MARFVLKPRAMMRHSLLVLVVGASACAARSSQVPTIPVANHYVCSDGDRMQESKLGWSDDDGDHYVASWPMSSTDVETVEYTIPRDNRADAIQHVWDTSKGRSRSEWRLLAREVCHAKGGYSDVLARFMSGESIDELSKELAVDHDQARSLVHDALISAQRRYFRDR